MFIFCKHKWKLVTETVTKSKFETAVEVIGDNTKKVNIPSQMCDVSRKCIQVFTCEKCGKLTRFVTEI